MKKYMFICFTLLFGLLTLTKSVSACEQHDPVHTHPSCCDQGHEDKTHDCCQTETSSEQDYEKHCDGQCKGAICQQSSIKFQLFFTLSNVHQWSSNPNGKVSFYANDNRITPGFLSIWLLPKIG